MSYEVTLQILTKLAAAHKERKDFVKAVKSRFTKLGSGAFRIGFSAEGLEYAFKLRRACPRRGSGFTMAEIRKSNEDEYNTYEAIKSKYPEVAAFVLTPTYHKLPNGHDVVFMPRVEVLGENWNYDTDFWDDMSKAQYRLITCLFSDAHGGNIGYVGDPEAPGCRLYMIDLNTEGDRWLPHEFAG